jgi:L-fuconolactonase
MTIVDAHVHIGLTKFVPVEVLLAQMEVAGIDQAILVQYMGQTDNRYLESVCQHHPGTFAPWGWVDTTQADATSRMVEAVERHGMVGFRVPASARSAGPNPFEFWGKLQELGMVVSLCGDRDTFGLPETAELVERHPGIRFRLEHLGHPRFDENDPFPRYQKVLALSRFPNVFIAYSGLYAASRQGYPYMDVIPFLRMSYESFGPRRILWGSDFPPVCSHETVAMNLGLFKAGWGFLSKDDRERILGKTATEFTRFV